MPHSARTICWRFLQDKLAAGIWLYRWQPNLPSICRFCDHNPEDAIHMVFLCPPKKIARLTLLNEFTTKVIWTDEELSTVCSLDCALLSIQEGLDILPYQLVACGLLGIWRMHYSLSDPPTGSGRSGDHDTTSPCNYRTKLTPPPSLTNQIFLL